MLRPVLRIGLWTLGGAAAVYFWAILVTLAGFSYNLAHWTVAATITVPASLFWRTGPPPSFYWLILLNAIIYGLVGLAIELLLRLRRQRR